MRTQNQWHRCRNWSRIILCVSTIIMVLVQPITSVATPILLAHYKFNGSNEDTTGNSAAMDLSGATIVNDVLALPATNYLAASAQIPGFSYASFTIAFDFKPYDFLEPHRTLLSGGPSYRWIGFESDAAGHLVLTLNNWNRYHSFTNVITTNQWHTLVCSVDLNSQTIITVLDGEQLPDIALQDFQFEVVGTVFEQLDQALTFWNYGNATGLHGQADNLRVYNQALSGAEIQSVLAPRLTIAQAVPSARISWPADLTGYVVETTTSLQPPRQWAIDNRTPDLIGDQKVLVDQLATGPRFYRLRRL